MPSIPSTADPDTVPDIDEPESDTDRGLPDFVTVPTLAFRCDGRRRPRRWRPYRRVGHVGRRARRRSERTDHGRHRGRLPVAGWRSGV